MASQDPSPTGRPALDERTRGFCGWGVFAPHKQTWLGFGLAWICVAAIIWLTAVFAKIGG